MRDSRAAWLLILGLWVGAASIAAEQRSSDPRAHVTLRGTAGDVFAIAEMRIDHPSADAIRERLATLGLAECDVYRIALRKFGGVTTMVRYVSKAPRRNDAERRREALEIFTSIAELLDARSTPFVLLKAATAKDVGSHSNETSYDYSFWQDTALNWRLITVDPDSYFRGKIDQATPQTSASDLAYWHLSLAAIERAQGRSRRAERLFEEAFEASDDLPPGYFLIHARAAAALASLAAAEADDDVFEKYCGAYALALGEYEIPRDGYEPLAQSPSEYPREAGGVGGHVVAEFTITENCRVTDIAIIDSEPPGLFDASAIEAIAEYRYLPGVRDGKVVSTPGIRTTLRFEPTP
jgi:TonB family protein